MLRIAEIRVAQHLNLNIFNLGSLAILSVTPRHIGESSWYTTESVSILPFTRATIVIAAMKDGIVTPEITSKYVIKAQAVKPSMVNLAFIRSGEQFGKIYHPRLLLRSAESGLLPFVLVLLAPPSNPDCFHPFRVAAASKALSTAAPSVASRPRSQSQRLAQFYQDTQEAAARAQRHRSHSVGQEPHDDSRDVTCMSVINLDYLRSGFQFEAAPLHSNQSPGQEPKTDTE